MTLRSMTGYGRGEVERDGVRASVELRAVNHRFLDVKVKLPRAWSALEHDLLAWLRERLGRGRVDVAIRRDAHGAAATEVVVDVELARSVQAGAQRLSDELGAPGAVDVGFLLGVQGVLSTREADVDSEAERGLVLATLEQALEQLLSMRDREGAALRTELNLHLATVERLTAEVAAIAADVPGAVRSRLERRIEELLAGSGVSADADRIVQEAAMLADKAGIDEEIARIGSHLSQARNLLDSDEPVGRRLEFLAQEFGREINTIGSKASESALSALVVELKSTLEKIREQAANVE